MIVKVKQMSSQEKYNLAVLNARQAGSYSAIWDLFLLSRAPARFKSDKVVSTVPYTPLLESDFVLAD